MWVSSMLWLALAGVVAALRCPGGQVCDDGSRCCELPGAESACCPQGIVRSLPMVKAGSVNEISENLCPTNVSCPSEYSCLRTPAGLYSCCPLSEAVSCGDSRHCCPRDSLCSLDGKFCLQVSGNTEIGAVICPGGELECPEQTTCCLTVDGSWGCCPMPQAVCCEDKEHCCPHDTTCDMVHSKCLSSEGKKPMWSKFPARKRVAWENATDSSRNNKCEDGLTCPDWTTCCQQQSPKFGCCPMQNAVCCADHIHCCPEGTKCDLIRSICVGTDERSQSPLLTKVLALAKKDEDVNCDDTTSCPDGHTCCLQSRGWGCCPYAEAVCCSDKVHCCPKGFTCITEQGICKQSTLSIPWTAKTPAQVRETMSSKDVQCDDEASCADGQTCCKSASGEWACCPLPQAVCCSDHIHCCPTSYTCNTAAGTCEQNALSIPWSAKTLAQVKTTNSKDVKCDDETSCADGQTCCRTAEGEWGCCPLPEAVCCSDHIHCCPTSYTCNTAAGTCEQNALSIPWSAKTLAQVKTTNSKDVKCDDETSCADGQTCCRTAEGEWGCCPLPEAVCCSDHIHCCPTSYTCNTAAGTCEQNALSIPWSAKTLAQVKTTNSKDVKCDDETSCADGQTCCRTAEGEWGCCPLPEAVCCSDHVHCCPKDYTCNTAAETCEQSPVSIPWSAKTPLQGREILINKDVKCDDETSCADGQTCCRAASGEWACCPLLEAVCCSDHVHCCPAGYTCNTSAGSCDKSLLSIPWVSRTQAQVTKPQQSTYVKCDDTASCKDGQTCCKTQSGDWACCHLPNAVCCEDFLHCCPSGYTCNLSAQTCDKQGLMLPWKLDLSVTLLPPTDATERDVKCDDMHYCKSSQTCCKTTTAGGWACCPYNQGVCCKDMRHCCSAGYKCSFRGRRCIKSKVLRWDENFSTEQQQDLL
ncbi:progranulin isoform X2 [Microcaecilia unicolor]|uniref:Progranulin isoform X2 n=1 Tax=Microcaecilia unicolor TaxID=1415580 RepID=A0A6P7ZT34_9AMPH|nr:progranulin isoform X2 [Microcaecilia unicolor]